MEINILLKLLCAHFLCDFLFQPGSLVDRKKSDDIQISLKANIMHSLIHAIAAYVIAGAWLSWYIPAGILVSHFAIDFLYKRKKDGLQPFLIDQLLHIIVLILLWLICEGQFGALWEYISGLFAGNKMWIVLIAYILILQPSSILIGIFTEKWSSQLNVTGNNGLQDAGKWIGYIERFLIITFIFTGNFEAIGFLLAAKSIFRYGDLKELQEIKMTEYVMIGTLSSFSVAIIIGVVFKYYLP